MRWASSTSPTPRRASSTPARSSASRAPASSTATLVEIGWRELFGAKVPFRRRYDLKGTVPAALVAKAGFPSAEPYVTGPVATTLHYQVATNGTSEVVGRFEIKGAKAALPPLGWTKEPGTDGQVAAGAEARRRRQAHDHRFRGPRQRPCRQGPGALRRRQRRAAGHAAAGQDRADRRCGRLEARSGRRRARRCAGRRSNCRACAPCMKSRDELAAKEPGGRGRHGAQPTPR